MTVTVMTDTETDQLISLRMSKDIPLSPEISLNGLPDEFYRWNTFYSMHRLTGYRIVQEMAALRVSKAMAVTLQHVPYADRLAHYVAYRSQQKTSENFSMERIQNPSTAVKYSEASHLSEPPKAADKQPAGDSER